jgi:flagellar biosynthesis protein
MTRKWLFRAVGVGGEDLEAQAPTVVCKGEYHLAETIVSLAKRYGVPVVERPELAEALSEVELDQEVPAHLFEVAASLLVEIGVLGKK